MEFDKRDKAIIESLYHNWRISATKLGKNIRLSRRQVDYRVKKYFDSKIIRAIFTVVDYSKLGYNYPAFAFVRLRDKKRISDVGKYLEGTKRCMSWGKALTEYDIFSNFIFKNKKEMNFFIKNLKGRFKSVIDELTFIIPIHSELYPLKSIGNNLGEVYSLTSKLHKKVKTDALDIKILKEIASNSRKQITEIADNVKISPERCLYRIRNLYDKKIIQGSRIQFGLKESGYFATCFFMEINLSDEIISKFRRLCELNPNINSLIISNKYPQITIQVFHKDGKTLREIVEKVNLILEDKKSRLSLIELVDDMNIVNPLPFL